MTEEQVKEQLLAPRYEICTLNERDHSRTVWLAFDAVDTESAFEYIRKSLSWEKFWVMDRQTGRGVPFPALLKVYDRYRAEGKPLVTFDCENKEEEK